jgi:hypothetical protein
MCRSRYTAGICEKSSKFGVDEATFRSISSERLDMAAMDLDEAHLADDPDSPSRLQAQFGDGPYPLGRGDLVQREHNPLPPHDTSQEFDKLAERDATGI